MLSVNYITVISSTVLSAGIAVESYGANSELQKFILQFKLKRIYKLNVNI